MPVLTAHYGESLALLHDEVRILIFDDPAELEESQRPVMVRSGRGPFKPARARRGRAMHEFFFSKMYEIPRTSAALALCASSLPVKSTVQSCTKNLVQLYVYSST